MNFNYDYTILLKGLLFEIDAFLNRYTYWKDGVTKRDNFFKPVLNKKTKEVETDEYDYGKPKHIGRGCMD